MMLDEYKKLSFKTDGNCEEVLIEEVWDELNREKRRMIQKELKKGKIPKIENYIAL